MEEISGYASELPVDTDSLRRLSSRRSSNERRRKIVTTGTVLLFLLVALVGGVLARATASMWGPTLLAGGAIAMVTFGAVLLEEVKFGQASLDPLAVAARGLLEAIPPTIIVVEGDARGTTATMRRGRTLLRSHRWDGTADELDAIDTLSRWRVEASILDERDRERYLDELLRSVELTDESRRFHRLVAASADESFEHG